MKSLEMLFQIALTILDSSGTASGILSGQGALRPAAESPCAAPLSWFVWCGEVQRGDCGFAISGCSSLWFVRSEEGDG